MSMDYFGVGRMADRRWTEACPRCDVEYEGITEGDTGASYYRDEDNCPQEYRCKLCDKPVMLCRACLESLPAPLCPDDGEEYVTDEAAKILGVSKRRMQQLAASLNKAPSDRFHRFFWSQDDLKALAGRQKAPGRKPRANSN